MNKKIKTVLAVALLSMPMTTYTTPTLAGDAPVATGGGGDADKIILGLGLLALISWIIGANGGSMGGAQTPAGN